MNDKGGRMKSFQSFGLQFSAKPPFSGCNTENRTLKTDSSFFRPDHRIWSGRRDLNSRPSPWQGDALPLSYSRFKSTTDSNDSMIVVKRATLKGMSWFELVSVQPQRSSCLGGKQNAIQDSPP